MFTTKKIFHYLLIITVALTACKKETDDDDDDYNNNNNNTTIGINSEFQFKGTVDGVDYHYEVGNNTLYGVGVGLDGGYDPDPNTGEASSFLESYIVDSDDVLIGISKRALYYTWSVTMADMNAFLPLGSANYTADPADGVTVHWRDNAGTYWSTEKGSGNQSGSTFNIMATTPLDTTYNKLVKVHIKLSCKLYNDAGDSMQLTDGEYVGYFDSLEY